MSPARERRGDADVLRLASRVYLHLGPIQAVARSELGALLAGRDIGLAGGDYAVLAALAEREGATLGQMADLLAIPRTSGRRAIDQLQRAGLVERRQEPQDRRSWRWLATSEGHRLVAELAGLPSDGSFARSVASLEPPEVEVLLSDLSAVLNGLLSANHQRNDPESRPPIRPADIGTPHALLELWLAISRIWRIVRGEQSRFLLDRTDGAVESGSYQALYYVTENASASGNDLASFLRVDQNTSARIVDRLESLGLVARTRNPADRRHVAIVPTEEGRRLLGAVPPIDPGGVFVGLVGDLPDGGARLAEVLETMANRLGNQPVIDLSGLDRLLEGFSRQSPPSAPTEVGADQFRAAMSRFVTGIAVVTIGRDGIHRGITVNSLTSVSLDPPTLLICFDRRSPALEQVKRHQAFAVNILAADQQHLAERFGRRESAANPHSLDPEMFIELDGVPALAGSLASVVCGVEGTYEAGSHTIVLATARLLSLPPTADSARALGFFRSRYLPVATPGAIREDEDR